MTFYDYVIRPFVEHDFMRRALVASLVLSLSAAPLGVFLLLRRMSLVGDSIAHGMMPGVAIAFILYGASIVPMTIGGLAVGLLIALGSGVISRFTSLREDASMATLYLISLALGVLLLQLHGSDEEVLHVLFGDVLEVSKASLVSIGVTATATLLGLSLFWRAIVAECMDPQYLSSVSAIGPIAHAIFLVLLVLNLVAGFFALGTVLGIGLMTLPAAAAKFWKRDVEAMCLVAIAIAMVSSVFGLLIAKHSGAPSGPAIVLVAGAIYLASMLAGPLGALKLRQANRKHFVR